SVYNYGRRAAGCPVRLIGRSRGERDQHGYPHPGPDRPVAARQKARRIGARTFHAMTRPQRISLGLLLAVQLLVGAVAALAQPLWLGHEPDYFGVVRFLAENGRLPARSDFDSAQRSADLAQATQPPL